MTSKLALVSANVTGLAQIARNRFARWTAGQMEFATRLGVVAMWDGLELCVTRKLAILDAPAMDNVKMDLVFARKDGTANIVHCVSIFWRLNSFYNLTHLILNSTAGCENGCSRHGQCTLEDGEYRCNCIEGWAGFDCSIALEMSCNDTIDNDHGTY